MNTIEATPTRFEPGAPPSDGGIPLSVPELRGNEWKYVKECLDTNWVSSVGPFVERFERMVADYVGAKYAVATVNGTAALHIALLVAGVKPNDEVLISTLTFIAPANAARYVGAFPVFIDAECDFWQMDTVKVTEFLEKECQWRGDALYNVSTERRVKAIVPVHILGHPVDMEPLLQVARKYNLTVIEDATESLGAKYKGRMTGALGDIACFSFNGNKIITTGGGGMIVTDNAELASHAKYLTTQAKDDPVEYVHKEIGFNYRLTNLQAAIGVAQMENLDQYVAIKRQIASAYEQLLHDMPGVTPMRQAPWAFGTFWMYTILIDANVFGRDSRALMHELAKQNIQSRPLWQPLHLSPSQQPAQAYRIEIAKQLYRQALSLPCSVGLTMNQLNQVVDAVKNR